MKKTAFCVTILSILLASTLTSGHALEITAGISSVQATLLGIQMKMDSLNAIILAFLNKIAACNAKKKLYVTDPTTSGRDADGCIDASTPITLINCSKTNERVVIVNNKIGCSENSIDLDAINYIATQCGGALQFYANYEQLPQGRWLGETICKNAGYPAGSFVNFKTVGKYSKRTCGMISTGNNQYKVVPGDPSCSGCGNSITHVTCQRTRF